MSRPPDTQQLWLTLGKPTDGKVTLRLSPLPPESDANVTAAIVVRGMVPEGWPVTIDLVLATAGALTAQVRAKL